jgi:hypothetical protein
MMLMLLGEYASNKGTPKEACDVLACGSACSR